MASPQFQGKINLTDAVQFSADEWDVSLSFSDADGVFDATFIQIGDVLLIDTSNFELGTVTRFSIEAVTSQDATEFQGRVKFADSNLSVPDISYSIGLDGAIFRPTTHLKLAIVPAPGVQGLPDKFAIYPKNADSAERLDALSGGSGTSSNWIKYEITAAQIAANASNLSSTEAFLFTLPAKRVIEKILLTTKEAFSGGSITAYKVSVGIGGMPNRYTSSYDVFTAADDSNRQMSISGDLESLINATSIMLHAECVGGTLDQAASGVLEVYVQNSDLP